MSNLLKLLNEIQYPIDDLDINAFGDHDIEIEAKKKELSIMPYLRTRNRQITSVLY